MVFLLIGIAGAQLEPLTAGTRYDWLEKILFGQATLSARASVWQGLFAGAATSFVLIACIERLRCPLELMPRAPIDSNMFRGYF